MAASYLATGLQSLSEIPQSRASRRPPSPRHSPRQRSSDHNHLRCTEDRRHCDARWRERGQAAPESADESESRERVRSGRVHESSFAYHRRLLSERFKSHFSPMTESALEVSGMPTMHHPPDQRQRGFYRFLGLRGLPY